MEKMKAFWDSLPSWLAAELENSSARSAEDVKDIVKDEHPQLANTSFTRSMCPSVSRCWSTKNRLFESDSRDTGLQKARRFKKRSSTSLRPHLHLRLVSRSRGSTLEIRGESLFKDQQKLNRRPRHQQKLRNKAEQGHAVDVRPSYPATSNLLRCATECLS